MIFTRLFVILCLTLCIYSYKVHFAPRNRFYISKTSLHSSKLGQLLDKKTLGAITDHSFKSIGCAKVLPPKDSIDDWKLWFSGRDVGIADDIADMATGRIFYMTSKNGITNWKNHEASPVLKPSKDGGDWWWFDSEHVGVGDIVVPGNSIQNKFLSSDSVFVMYTFGGNSDAAKVNEKNIKGVKLAIGVAVSQDGIHWSKVEGNSLYASIVQPGAPSEFDGQFVGWPSIVELVGEFKMYYHTYDPRAKKFVVGLAIARDGLLNWIKVGPVFDGGINANDFDVKGVTRRHAMRLKDGKFRMWYEGISSDGRHSIGLATSMDGILWIKASPEPVFAPSDDPEAWDSGGVGSPNLVWLAEKKRWRMYYIGSAFASALDTISGGGDSIGVAESIDEEGMIFQRMQL